MNRPSDQLLIYLLGRNISPKQCRICTPCVLMRRIRIQKPKNLIDPNIRPSVTTLLGSLVGLPREDSQPSVATKLRPSQLTLRSKIIVSLTFPENAIFQLRTVTHLH